MEISTAEEDADPPLLTDSGTESYTESPIAEEDSEPSETFAPSPCQSEDSTILCDIDSENKESKALKLNNLLDKAISVDEDSLVTPLEPVKCFLKVDSPSLLRIISGEELKSVSEDTKTEIVPDEDSSNSINNLDISDLTDGTNGYDHSILEGTNTEILNENTPSDSTNSSANTNPESSLEEISYLDSKEKDQLIENVEMEKSDLRQAQTGESNNINQAVIETKERNSSNKIDIIHVETSSEIYVVESSVVIKNQNGSLSSEAVTETVMVKDTSSRVDEVNQVETENPPPLQSILRRNSMFDEDYICGLQVFRKVSFPFAESELVSYREPARSHWKIDNQMPAQEIMKEYQESCKANHSLELDTLKKQILEIKNNQNRSAVLVLANMTITRDVCETLEDLFKITNFKSVTIEDCKFKDDTLFELLNMLEYYETSTELVLAMNIEDFDMWKYFTDMVGKSLHLESLTCKGLNLTEQYTKPLVHAIKNNSNVTTLRFEKCKLVFTPTFYLVDMLMQYHGLRELYLTETGLQNKEMETVCRYLTNNSFLQVLDISNNIIGDRGLIQLTTGLMSQCGYGPGLSVLIMVNNSITVKSGPVLGNLILCSKNLHTLNIGYNVLDDQTILDIQESLMNTKKLEGLGLQNTLISCVGAGALALAIESNKSLKKINLKGNKGIKIEGLEQLSKALTNSKIIKLELDDTNRNCNDQIRYKELVKKINEICAVNKSLEEQNLEDSATVELSKLISRKVSLSCSPSLIPPLPVPPEVQIRKVPSPHPSSRNRSGTRSRFQVSRVSDPPTKPPPSPSRFKVFAVSSPNASFSSSSSLNSPPQELEEDIRSFRNVRSSVSSVDSMDSIGIKPGNSSSVSSIDEDLAEHSGENDI